MINNTNTAFIDSNANDKVYHFSFDDHAKPAHVNAPPQLINNDNATFIDSNANDEVYDLHNVKPACVPLVNANATAFIDSNANDEVCDLHHVKLACVPLINNATTAVIDSNANDEVHNLCNVEPACVPLINTTTTAVIDSNDNDELCDLFSDNDKLPPLISSTSTLEFDSDNEEESEDDSAEQTGVSWKQVVDLFQASEKSSDDRKFREEDYDHCSRKKLLLEDAWRFEVGNWVARTRTLCPMKSDKEEIMQLTGMSHKQVCDWFCRLRQCLPQKVAEETSKSTCLCNKNERKKMKRLEVK